MTRTGLLRCPFPGARTTPARATAWCSWDDAAVGVEQLAVEVGRVADRLRSMSQERLTRGFPPYASRAAAALAVAQLLADTAAEVTGEPAERRTVPDLGPLVVGDQVAVTGTDLVQAASGMGRDPRVDVCVAALRDLPLPLPAPPPRAPCVSPSGPAWAAEGGGGEPMSGSRRRTAAQRPSRERSCPATCVA